MCVIVAVMNNEKRPSSEALRAMAKTNAHGAGVAWLKNGRVKFIKGLAGAEEVEALIAEHNIQAPFLIHFRITSVGITHPDLTHPFPVTKKVENSHSGETAQVLAHNGTWGKWDDTLVSACMMRGWKMPSGLWNDTRAMAFLLYHYGSTWLHMVLGNNQSKVLTLDKDGIEIVHGEMIEHEGYLVSNENWIPRTVVHHQSHGVATQHQPQQHSIPLNPNGPRYVNINHWNELTAEERTKRAMVIRRSPKFASCSAHYCLVDLYKGTGMDPQHGDYCAKHDDVWGNKKCASEPEIEATVIPPIPLTTHTDVVATVPNRSKCSNVACKNAVKSNSWFCDECESRFRHHQGEM